MHYKDALRKLAIRDDRFIESILTHDPAQGRVLHLDPERIALVSLAALIALDAPIPAYQWAVESALEARLSADEVVDVLIAVLPIAGVPRVIAAAPRLAIALGYDVDDGLEGVDEHLHR